MKKKYKMTPRQWWLYNFLSRNRKTWFSEEDICFYCSNDLSYGGDKYVHNWRNEKGSKCPGIWQDMKEINLSYEVDKVIITKGRMFKVAESERELNEHYLDKCYENAINALVRIATIRRKAKADGQGKLISLAGKQIDDKSKAKRFIEAFAEDGGEEPDNG